MHAASGASPRKRATLSPLARQASQSAARPNPSSETKRCGDRQRQKGLCVVFHAVLQHTLRPRDDGRAGIRCCVYKRHRQNSNGCLSRSFADIKELLRSLFRCATLATSVCGSIRRTRHIGIKCGRLPSEFMRPPTRVLFLDAADRAARGISATSHKSHCGEDRRRIFRAGRISRYQTRNIWGKLRGGGIAEHSANFLLSRG